MMRRKQRKAHGGPAPLRDEFCYRTHKACFPTWCSAAAAAGRIRDQHGGAGIIQPYHCHWCHRFHVGNVVGHAMRKVSH